MGMGYLSGQKQDRYAQKMVQKQYEADLANWEFNWQQAQDAYTYALEDLDIAKWNFDQQREYRNKQAARDLIDQDRERLFDYNEQVKAYNASIEAYGVQLDYNDIANDLATTAAAQAYQDQLTLLGYQFEDIKKGKAQTEKKIGRQREDLVNKRNQGKTVFKVDKKALKQSLNNKVSEYNAKLELQKIQGFDFEGKVKAIGQTGRSADRNAIIAKQSSQRLEYAIADAIGRSEQTAGLDIEKIGLKLKELGDSVDLQDQTLVDELWNTRVNVEFNEAQLKENLKITNLEYERNEEKRKLDKYQADLKARDMIAPAPILPPQVSKPLELPEPKLQKPKAPRKGPEPIKGAAVTGHGLAGLASGMQSMASAAAALG